MTLMWDPRESERSKGGAVWQASFAPCAESHPPQSWVDGSMHVSGVAHRTLCFSASGILLVLPSLLSLHAGASWKYRGQK